MKRTKDLRAVNAQFRALLVRGDVDPDQKKHVESAIEELKAFRRRRKLTRAAAYACVRKVAESLLSAFRR